MLKLIKNHRQFLMVSSITFEITKTISSRAHTYALVNTSETKLLQTFNTAMNNSKLHCYKVIFKATPGMSGCVGVVGTVDDRGEELDVKDRFDKSSLHILTVHQTLFQPRSVALGSCKS